MLSYKKSDSQKEEEMETAISLIQEIITRNPYDEALSFSIPPEVLSKIEKYEDEGISVSEGGLFLRDLALKSKIIAEYHYNSLDPNSEVDFFEKAKELMAATHSFKKLSIIEEFIFLGSSQRDIFISAKKYLENNENNFVVFEILHIFDRAMSKQFSYSIESFIIFFVFAYEKIETDLATRHYITKFCDFLFANEQNCLRIYLSCVHSDNKFITPIYNNIVLRFYQKYGYMKNDLLKKIQRDENINQNTIYLLGRILFDEKVHTGTEIELLKKCAKKGSDDQKLSAFSTLVLHLGKSQDIDSFFKHEIANKNTQAIFALGHKLSFEWAEFVSHPDFILWTKSLAYIPVGMKGAEKHRDFFFSEALSSYYEIIIQSLELCFSFYSEQNVRVDIEMLFTSTLSELVKDDFFST